MKDDRSARPLAPTERSLPENPEEPPGVARLMIEIRSDGRRTIARGALEDSIQGEKVALEAHGTSPAALAASLIKSLFSAPLLARAAARRLLRGR
jgi:hypothetical protein